MEQQMESQSKTGLWLGLVVVAIIVILFAFYYYYSDKIAPSGATTTISTEQSQDEVAALEQELQAENIDSLDSELSDIDKELAQ